MQYHATTLDGYRNIGDFVDKDFAQQTPTQADLDELIHADSGKKLFEFAKQWSPFTRRPFKQFPADDKEEIRAIHDTRELMLLVLSIKSLLDNGACNSDALREIGFRIDDTSETERHYSVVYLPSGPYLPDWVEGQNTDLKNDLCDDYASSVMVPPVTHIVEYSGIEIKERGLYLPSQKEFADTRDNAKRYKVFEFTVTTPGRIDDSYPASWIMDDIMQLFLKNISTYVASGIVKHGTGCNMLSFWLLVSERFAESRVQICRTCGLPVFVSDERGAKRRYCANPSCKRTWFKAKKYQGLVNERGLSRTEAAKKARIAASTAERILRRNGLDVHPPVKD